MSEGHNTTARNINGIINQIGNIFLTASKTTYSHNRVSTPPHGSEPRNAKRKKWFNNECRRARNLYHTTRKTYNRHKNTHNKEQLKHVSKAYKQVISKNVRKHNSKNIAKLKKKDEARKTQGLWEIINSATKTNKKNAPLDDLFQYFKNLNTIQKTKMRNPKPTARLIQPRIHTLFSIII